MGINSNIKLIENLKLSGIKRRKSFTKTKDGRFSDILNVFNFWVNIDDNVYFSVHEWELCQTSHYKAESEFGVSGLSRKRVRCHQEIFPLITPHCHIALPIFLWIWSFTRHMHKFAIFNVPKSFEPLCLEHATAVIKSVINQTTYHKETAFLWCSDLSFLDLPSWNLASL